MHFKEKLDQKIYWALVGVNLGCWEIFRIRLYTVPRVKNKQPGVYAEISRREGVVTDWKFPRKICNNTPWNNYFETSIVNLEMLGGNLHITPVTHKYDWMEIY